MRSWGESTTDIDLPFGVANCAILSFALLPLPPSPTSPLRSCLLLPRSCVRVDVETGTDVLGVTGDVGGFANGARLIEWAARLCACAPALFADFDVRVFVKVTVTEKVSPAKNADCDGATETRMPVSSKV